MLDWCHGGYCGRHVGHINICVLKIALCLGMTEKKKTSPIITGFAGMELIFYSV